MRRKISTSSNSSATSTVGYCITPESLAVASAGLEPSPKADPKTTEARRLTKRHRARGGSPSSPSLLQQVLSMQPVENMLSKLSSSFSSAPTVFPNDGGNNNNNNNPPTAPSIGETLVVKPSQGVLQSAKTSPVTTKTSKAEVGSCVGKQTGGRNQKGQPRSNVGGLMAFKLQQPRGSRRHNQTAAATTRVRRPLEHSMSIDDEDDLYEDESSMTTADSVDSLTPPMGFFSSRVTPAEASAMGHEQRGLKLFRGSDDDDDDDDEDNESGPRSMVMMIANAGRRPHPNQHEQSDSLASGSSSPSVRPFRRDCMGRNGVRGQLREAALRRLYLIEQRQQQQQQLQLSHQDQCDHSNM